ncbi:MAG: hypothetical protein MI861_26230 [Pirellulales bacterium]|nr:hypothetical protein [Pirellulales bacterium]
MLTWTSSAASDSNSQLVDDQHALSIVSMTQKRGVISDVVFNLPPRANQSRCEITSAGWHEEWLKINIFCLTKELRFEIICHRRSRWTATTYEQLFLFFS